MPAFRKFIAMPPPMVPAPMTATLLIARGCTSGPTSGILLAARSAANTWRSALHSGVCIRARKISRSLASASSNLYLVAFSTASTHLTGAGKLRDMPATMLRAKPK